MIQVSFLTIHEQDAVELAAELNRKKLLMFDTIEEHIDLMWDGERPERRALTHLNGITKALLYTTVEKVAFDLLGGRLVRIWATPVTSLDPTSTNQLMSWIAKV